VAANSVAGGVSSVINGGKFGDGFLTSALNSGARYLYNTMAGYDVNAAPGENRSGDDKARQVYEPDENGRLATSDRSMNLVGLNKEFDGSWLDSLKQGGVFTRVLNMVPGVNAIGSLDDYWQNNLNNYYLLPITIPGAVLITVPAILDRVPVYQRVYPFTRRR